MWRKSIYLLLIFAAFYTSLMINYPSETLKSLGYNRALDWYAASVSSRAVCQVLYDPGLRPLNLSCSKLKIGTLLPGNNSDYAAQLEQLLAGQCQVIVECSAADTWHTSQDGQIYLAKLRRQAYRAVIYDGGHHLPTLGLAPDIIVVPELAGYAVHSYMADGMKLTKIHELIKETGSNTMLVSVPRWALIKNEQALNIIIRKALANVRYNSNSSAFKPVVRERMSKIHGIAFAWVNRESLDNSSCFANNLKSMGIHDLQKVYLAFDYNHISLDQSNDFTASIRKKIGVPVECVNQAVKVANVYWSGYNVLPQPGHSFKNHGSS
ncbi:MAG: hypothetical protein PHX14_12005 [Syntrophomonadaceae bacterium]|nr:hypothetical protein [Syntrophomonadaceae bacterium]